MSEPVKWYFATDVPVVWDGTGVGRVPGVVLLSDYKRAMAEKEAELTTLKARCEGMREACQALMDYEKVMDGADGCGENDELYWKAVRFARAALAALPVEGESDAVADMGWRPSIRNKRTGEWKPAKEEEV